MLALHAAKLRHSIWLSWTNAKNPPWLQSQEYNLSTARWSKNKMLHHHPPKGKWIDYNHNSQFISSNHIRIFATLPWYTNLIYTQRYICIYIHLFIYNGPVETHMLNIGGFFALICRNQEVHKCRAIIIQLCRIRFYKWVNNI